MPELAQDRVMARGFRLLWRAIRDEPYFFTISVVSSILYSAVTIGTAYLLGKIMADVVEPAFARGYTSTTALVFAGLALLGVTVAKVAGLLGRRLAGGVMQFRLFARYRKAIARKYIGLPLRWHHEHPTGALLSTAQSDVESAWNVIAPLPFAVGTAVMIVVAMVALLVTDWAIAVVGFLVFPGLFLLNVAYSRIVAPRARRVQQLRAEVSTVAHESFDGALVVKTLGREAAETARFSATAHQLRDALISVGRVRGLFDPLMDALPSLATVAALYIGAHRLQAGALGVADIVTVAYLFTILGFPLRAIGWVLGDLPRSVVGWERMTHVLESSGEMSHGSRRLVNNGSARLELDQVTMGYREDQPVVSDVSFAISPGTTLALVGPTGSGKSTLIALVTRFLDPDSGEVRLDGVPLPELLPGELARHLGWVGQSTFLFEDSVRGNVTLGEDFTEEQVWAALQLAQAVDFVTALPDGLDTQLSERGASLSGGQRQRLALARALIRRPRLLVLDDATSSVDPLVERRILTGLHQADVTTVLLVAYRRASITLADEVVYLERGQVIAHGRHEELLVTTPGYADVLTAYEQAQQQRARAGVGESRDEAVVR